MVLASMRAPRTGVYLIQEVCETPERLDLDLLQRAWQRMAERHTALRTSIEIDSGGKLRQRVNLAEIAWQELDWSRAARDEKPLKLAAWLRNDRDRGFDFGAGVPARVTLIHWAGSCTLIWSMHHALLDARSYLIAWREWFGFYEALSRGDDLRLPQSRPFSAQVEWLQRQDWRAAQQYWQHNLAGLGETTGYLVDRISTPWWTGDEGPGRRSVRLSDELTQALEGFAQQHSITVNTLVQGAWALLLSRYSGRRNVVFGATRAGRQSSIPEASGMIGLFINTLPVRVAAPLDAPLVSWLREIRAGWTNMQAYEQAPLDKIREWSGLPPGQPLFDTVLNFDREPAGETLRKLGGAWLNREFTRLQRTDSTLTLAVYGKPVLSFDIVYDTRLFGQEMVAGMAGHLQTLMESFLRQQDSRVGDLKMLTPGEERDLLRRRTQVPFDFQGCAHGLVERQVRRTPENTALEAPGGSVSYRDLNAQANRLARCLRARGAGPEERIVICLDRSPEIVIAILAALKADAAFVPLEPGLPRERLAQMLESARPKFAISEEVNLGSGHCEVVSWERLQQEMASQSDADLAPLATPENAAYVIFTSGSTGTPKGVLVTHRSLVNHTLAASQVYGISEADRRLQFASVGSDVFVAEVFNYLSHGAALVFGLSRVGTSAGDFLRFLDQRRITITGIPSTWWAELVAALSDGRFTLPTSLRAVVAGMERVDPEVFQAWKRLTGRGIRWFNAYGPTEATGTATIYEAGSSAWEGQSCVPIGTSLANTTAYVLDGGMSPLPAGVVGELFIGGAGVARGYLNSALLTAERFLPDPFRGDGEGRLYRTGDLAYFLPDRNLVFAGRRDRQVKIRGYRIELEEIEAVLARHHAVQQCAVIVQSQQRQDRLVAYLTARGPAPSREDLLAHLSRHLPDHMLPAAFVTLPEMPRTPSGKLDRRALAQREPAQLDLTESFREPVGPVERRLVALWADLFGVPRVGRQDNFFELGGDSLTATRLITRTHEEFGRELDLAALLGAPTIARLAAMLSACSDMPGAERLERQPDVIPIQPRGDGIPLFWIHPGYEGVRLARHLGKDHPLFGIPIPAAQDSAAQRSVDQLAAECSSVLRRFRPEGPYAVAGWCASGVIALEMARQLEQQGCEVSFAAMLDVRSIFLPPLSAAHLAWVRFWRRGRHLVYVASRQPKGLWSSCWNAMLGHASDPLPEHTQAMMRHHPLPWAGRMVHIWASDSPRGRYFSPAFGWNHLAPNGFVFHEVPGDHLTLVQEPSVAEVARLLVGELERAEQTQLRASGYGASPADTGSQYAEDGGGGSQVNPDLPAAARGAR